jgi:hypothetical protein
MFKELKQHPACSDYILDLLEYVENSLLRVETAKRAKIDDIVEKFEALDKNCQLSPEYCSSRKKQPRMNNPGLPEIVEFPEYSDETLADELPSTPPIRRLPHTHNSTTMRRNSRRSVLNGEPEGSKKSSMANGPVGQSITTNAPDATQSFLSAEGGSDTIEDMPIEINHEPVQYVSTTGTRSHEQPSSTAKNVGPDGQRLSSAQDISSVTHGPIVVTSVKPDEVEHQQHISRSEADPLRLVSPSKNEFVDSKSYTNKGLISSIEREPRPISSSGPNMQQDLPLQNEQELVRESAPLKKGLRARSKKKILKIVDFCFGIDET